MDALSDWDDWSEDEPEWWLRHPLHRPRKLRPARLLRVTIIHILPENAHSRKPYIRKRTIRRKPLIT